jgi:DNA polymerase-3 subunit delta
VLPPDRALLRGEIEKLALYVHPATRIGEETVRAIVGDGGGASLDALALAVGEGDLVALERALRQLDEEGTAPVALLRAVQRHLQRLHLGAAKVAAGESAAGAVAALRPPVFWKAKARFEAAVGRHAPARLAASLDALTQAELDAKTTGLPDATLARRALTRCALALRP